MQINILLSLLVLVILLLSCKESTRNFSRKTEGVSLLTNIEKAIEVNIDLNNDCLPFDSLMTIRSSRRKQSSVPVSHTI